MFLTRFGIPKLWREDPEVAWAFMRYWLPTITRWLAPSFGYGVERVPREGGLVIAVNHLSAIDPPLIGSYSPRAIHYMAKAELLAVPVVGEILRWAGAFPVRRGEGDREALRRARELVRRGYAIGLFVEGTRQRLGYPGLVHPGGVMIAVEERVPIVPCGLDSFGWSRRNRRPCCVVWGEPMDVDGVPRSGAGAREVAAAVGAEIVRLWRQAAEAVAASFPPELPGGTRRSEPIRPGQGARVERPASARARS